MNVSVQLKQLVAETFSAENAVINRFFPESLVNPIKRSKLWELNEMHRCPVIGVCLSVNELVRFARRFSFTASLRDEYSMHVEAVDRSDTRNMVSKAIQKHLDMKYKNCIAYFNQAKTDADVQALWKEYYARGEGAGAMWASLTHKAVSDKTRQIVYADMHMLSHQTGAGQAADLRRLKQLEKENAETKIAMERLQHDHANTEAKLQKKLSKAINELESLRQTCSSVATLQARIIAYESGAAMIEMGRRLMTLTSANEQLRIVAKRVSMLEKALEAAGREVALLVQERNSLAVERDTLENLLRTSDPEERACSQLQPVATHLTQNSCVLCVGGRTALLPQYRTLAKQLGIHLLHHDGGQQEALSRLPDLISRANAVICPTDCVSHSAYYQLKRHCKRNNKPCLLFKGASISGFAKALTQLSSDKNCRGGNAIKTIQRIVQ